jgi:hypothetical protein
VVELPPVVVLELPDGVLVVFPVAVTVVVAPVALSRTDVPGEPLKNRLGLAAISFIVKETDVYKCF